MAEPCARHSRRWIWCSDCRRATLIAKPAPRQRRREYDAAVDSDLSASAVCLDDLMSIDAEPAAPCIASESSTPAAATDSAGACAPGQHYTQSTTTYDFPAPARSESVASYGGGDGGASVHGGSSGASDAGGSYGGGDGGGSFG